MRREHGAAAVVGANGEAMSLTKERQEGRAWLKFAEAEARTQEASGIPDGGKTYAMAMGCYVARHDLRIRCPFAKGSELRMAWQAAFDYWTQQHERFMSHVYQMEERYGAD